MTHAPTQIELFAALEIASNLKASGATVVRLWVNGHDVTDKMPLTCAQLEKMRPRCNACGYSAPHHHPGCEQRPK